MKANVLVIANRTAASPDLLGALAELAGRRPVRFHLLVPPTAPGPDARATARDNLQEALTRLEDAGLEATGDVGTDSDPVVAAIEAFDPARHDEIIVSTLPESASHWLDCDGPVRIGRATGALVHHVVARETPAPHVVHLDRHPHGQGILTPLVPLTYGSRPS